MEHTLGLDCKKVGLPFVLHGSWAFHKQKLKFSPGMEIITPTYWISVGQAAIKSTEALLDKQIATLKKVS